MTQSLWVSRTWTCCWLVKGVGSGFWIFLEYQSDSSCEILLDFVESYWISKRLGQISMRSQQISIDRTENTNKPLLSVENDGFPMCRRLKTVSHAQTCHSWVLGAEICRWPSLVLVGQFLGQVGRVGQVMSLSGHP